MPSAKIVSPAGMRSGLPPCLKKSSATAGLYSRPAAAVVEFRAGPQPLFQRETPLRRMQSGWAVCVWVNDKNKQGAFEGFYPMSVLLRNEKIEHVNGGPDDDNLLGNRYAREHCEQLGAPFKK